VRLVSAYWDFFVGPFFYNDVVYQFYITRRNIAMVSLVTEFYEPLPVTYVSKKK